MKKQTPLAFCCSEAALKISRDDRESMDSWISLHYRECMPHMSQL